MDSRTALATELAAEPGYVGLARLTATPLATRPHAKMSSTAYTACAKLLSHTRHHTCMNTPNVPKPSITEDWSRLHAVLQKEELELGRLVTAFTRGEVSREELLAWHRWVGGTRALLDAVTLKLIEQHPSASEPPAAG